MTHTATLRRYRAPKVRDVYDTAVLRNLSEALRASGLPEDVNGEILELVDAAMDKAKETVSLRLL